MIVRQVWCREFRSWQEMLWELQPGCTAILGANGAGKSSILTAIDVCLFGGRDLARYVRRGGTGEMEVGLEIEHRGREYRVRRGYTLSGRGKPFLTVEMAKDDGWQAMTQETVAATQAWIEHALGLSRATLRASALLMQGHGDEWTAAQPRERKQVLADILGLGVYERLSAQARERRLVVERDRDREQAVCDAAIEAVERLADVEDVAGLETKCMEYQREIAVLSTRVQKARERVAALEHASVEQRALREQIAECEQRTAELGVQIERREQAIEDARQAVSEIAQLDAMAAEIPALEQALAAQRKRRDLQTKRDAVMKQVETVEAGVTMQRAELDRIRKRIEVLKARDDETCDLCGQPLTDDAKHRSLATLEMQVQAKATGVEQSERRARELAEQAEQLQAQIEELAVPVEDPAQRLDLAHRAEVSATAHRGKLAVAERAAHEIAEHRRAQAGIEERVGQLRGRLAGLPQLADLGEAEHDLNALIETERSTRTLHEGMQARLERARTLTNERAAAVQRAQEAARAVARLTGQAGRWRALEGAFGRDGVPALILESAAIPQIESDANRILADLGVELVVELRTQRALKTEDRLADTLDIIVRDGRGDAPYEDFSGGERTRLNLALRIALARLLAHRRGSEVRLLALDEPEFLDETGMLALARVLSGLAGEFDSIALVSHHPALADAFDQSVRVEKDGDRSRVAALVGT